ncbi:phosphonate metabolism protein PhnG [Actibacterium mucosum KCTC 23349]|uniref:Phosphonate metabolism protein PhnG n=1 Tax=Actibacterium mucosum KCTC 23349 TaxID=1454373 RepID=A0A037ZJE2_9RHOB|nr:phosphonate C-P lyase system protein PhnG [Actibacterium mucosum]KAJ55682.1 phosphonate metabolism protein PhnG [Actibacterium mucosum KCTC 23349]
MIKIDTRQEWMSLLAKSPKGVLSTLVDALGAAPSFSWLRAPEIGGVMVRGRAGGTGAAFNMGEMTITRCTLKLEESGVVGHAYVQGRDKDHARNVALVDALLQTERAADIRASVLTPLAADMTTRRNTRAAKAAATKVDFFTLARGED